MTKAINHNTNNKDNTVGVSPTSPKAHQKTNVKKDIKQEITDKIIALMEAGPEAWQKTWSDAAAGGMPTNATTGAPYRGVNVLLLWSHRIEKGYTSNRWMTYRQASAAGAQVRKGEKSITCVYFEMIKKKNKEEGVREFFPMIRAFSLFNLDQIDNVPAELMDPETDTAETMEFRRHEKAEQFLMATGARIDHNGHRAFYRPSTDHIILPEREAFITPANYYATACHELVHWTGHESRLDRDFSKSSRFDDEHYAFEELVAELGASFLCGHFGFIDATVENHASYLASWIRGLKNDRNAIFTAAKHASSAYDYLMTLTGQDTESEQRQHAA